jgi:hypothetical protein
MVFRLGNVVTCQQPLKVINVPNEQRRTRQSIIQTEIALFSLVGSACHGWAADKLNVVFFGE